MSLDATYSVPTDGQLYPHLHREWLLTNGLGSFAMSTVVGCNTRRYHGLLCAATLPPVGRVMALNRVGEVLYLDGVASRALEFSVNQFRGNIFPRGDQYLRQFDLADTARWEYDIEGVHITKELQLLWQRNVIGLRYTVEPANPARKVRLDLLPFTGLRDFHGLRRASGANFNVTAYERQVSVEHDRLALFIKADDGSFQRRDDWWYGHIYPQETERGQDDTEDLFTPGRFTIERAGIFTVTLWASMEAIETPNWDEEHARRTVASGVAGSTSAGFAAAPAGPPAQGQPPAAPSIAVQRLFRAAVDFIVRRKNPDGAEGTSVLAGFPWFADWGRDTFIALPGLLLTTGRFEEARQVLRVFGQYVNQGMIPNRFDDYSNEPHYNTVDASLWYIHAAFEYLRLSRDAQTFDRYLLPACQQIIAGYRNGTRFHIKMEEDGLITQGDPTTQLTWMDAKCGDRAFTPRQGKAVEINALWYHALVLMEETALAKRVAESFGASYWISPFRGLADGINEGQQDTSIRPNQIFAVSLPNSPLSLEQQQAVVEVVRRELLTPYGLRTLARGQPRYHGRYTGPQPERDEAYHNGTVWPWPLGAFLSAYLKVNGRTPFAVEQAKAWLRPLLDLMSTGDGCCIGQIPEIFEADEPHRPVGCPAQAWSIAEILRLAVELGL